MSMLVGLCACGRAGESTTMRKANEPPDLLACTGADCCPQGVPPTELTPGDDAYGPENGPQCILALAGSDAVVGGNQHDVILGGDDDDHLEGGNGNDAISGGAGHDTIAGDTGDDQLYGGEGDDTIAGNQGEDLLRGGPGLDVVEGGRGDDVIVLGNVCEVMPGEVLDGGPGDDTLLTPFTTGELAELGVSLVSIEHVVVIAQPDTAECEQESPDPYATDVDGDREDYLCAVLAQTSAVVVGTVTNIDYTYEARPGEGPREVATLGNLTSILGTGAPQTQVKLRNLRGYLPDDSSIDVSHQPVFELGERYVVFLWNRAWKFSPVPRDFFYRLDEVDGQEVLVNDAGYVLGDVTRGQLMYPTFTVARVGTPQTPIGPPPDDLDRAIDSTTYAADLQALAAQCPAGPNGVFNPFPRGIWNEILGTGPQQI